MMYKKLLLLFKILLLIFIVISIYGAVKFFKQQSIDKKYEKDNYILYEKKEKSNLEKIADGFKDLFNRNFKRTDTNVSIDESYNEENEEENVKENSEKKKSNFLGNAVNKIKSGFKKFSNKAKGVFSNASNKIKNTYNNVKNGNSTSTTESKEYDTYNFDDSILLFEGKQDGKHIIDLLSKLIDNANNNFYSNTTVVLKNINSDSQPIVYSYTDDNKSEYISKLENAKKSINSNDEYNVSFGYNRIKTHVDQVIISKQ